MSHDSMAEMLVGAVLKSLPDCQAIYRFGSWGTSEQRPDSDIDLAILPASPLDPVRRWQLAQSLASLAGRDVDLMDLLCASTVMRMQVLATGDRLFCADDYAVEMFEDVTFSSYARLNEERGEILSEIRARGSVHGK